MVKAATAILRWLRDTFHEPGGPPQAVGSGCLGCFSSGRDLVGGLRWARPWPRRTRNRGLGPCGRRTGRPLLSVSAGQLPVPARSRCWRSSPWSIRRGLRIALGVRSSGLDHAGARPV